MKTTNTKARSFVQSQTPFQANNLKGVDEGHFYVVYSYNWYPLFIYCFVEKRWFSNSDKYSVSTSKQYGQAHPLSECVALTHEQMKDLLQGRAVVA